MEWLKQFTFLKILPEEAYICKYVYNQKTVLADHNKQLNLRKWKEN